MIRNGMLTALALLLGVGAATASLAADTQSPKAKGAIDYSTSADANMDARIDVNEATQVGQRVFGGFDVDGDGFISRDEYLTSVGTALEGRYQTRQANMAKLDASKLTRDKAGYSEMDADGDGKVSRDEYMGYAQQAYTTAAQGTGSIASDLYAGGALRQSYDPLAADLNADASISDWEAAADVEMDFGVRDADGDDYLSQEEWEAKLDQPYDAARSEKRFTALDTDKDERLSADEFSSWSTARSSSVARGTSETTGETSDTANTDDSADSPAGEEGWSAWTFRRYHF